MRKPIVTRRTCIGLLSALGMSVAAGCTPRLPAPPGGGPSAAPARVKAGVFAPLTGDGAAYGQYMVEGFRLKTEAAETVAQLGGMTVELVVEDDAGKPEQAVSLATKLVNQDNVSVLIGSVFSPNTMATQPIANKSQVPQITPSSTAAAITQQGNPWIFRVALPDTVLGTELARYVAKDLQRKRVGFTYINDDFGKGGYDAFAAEAKRLGIDVVAAEAYGRGDKDFTAQLSRIKAANPDVFVQWSRYAEAALISQQAKQLGYTVPMLGSDAHAAPKFLELAGQSAEGSYYVGHWSISADWPESMAFVERYRARYSHDPDQYAAQGYTAAEILVDALKRAQSGDRAKLRDALAATRDLKTAMGTMGFNEQGDLVYPTFMVKIVGGKDAPARKS
jgi:branched-chain amino acid transport system substrate-binding protein